MDNRLIELSKLLKDDYGRPLVLTPGQLGIFELVATRKHPYNIILAPTQYGKDRSIAAGLAWRIPTQAEKWAVVAPSQGKAEIFMQYFIQHLFDFPFLLTQLEIDIPLERLRHEKSKDRLTFRNGGEIYALTAEARLKSVISKSLMGYGAPNLILNESSLIDNELYATAMRMVGGHKDKFVLEIGNPWNREHLYRTWTEDPDYHKIFIDYRQGLAEGRYTPDFIERMRRLPFFDIFYECKFPGPEMVDRRGYRLLIPSVEEFFAKPEPKGRKRLGVDVGRGGDWNTWIIRTDNSAWVKDANQVADLMQTAVRTKEIIEEELIDPHDVNIDDSGIGGGVTDRLHEMTAKTKIAGAEVVDEVELNVVNGVRVGEEAKESERFANIKAEINWEARKWLVEGGRLRKHGGFYQAQEIRYKENSAGKLQMETKEDMAGRGVPSPDFWDAFVLTFFEGLKVSWSIG